ncbi:E3 ubiquitin protein ligase MBR2-like protein isoform X1 [Tanacetum coccineum]
MDVYSSKRPVGGIAAPKKKPVAALKDTAGSQSGPTQVCSRVGCCGGRLNNSKGTKNKCIEKPKPLKLASRSSSSKEVSIASSSKSSISNVKKPLVESDKKLPIKIGTIPTESKTVSNEPEISERKSVRSQTQLKLKSRSSITDQNSEMSNVRKKRFTQGESSSSGKGKKIVGVSPNEGHVSDPKTLRNMTSGKASNVPSARTKKSLTQLHGDDFSVVKSTNVIREMPHIQELSDNGGGSSSDSSSVNFRNRSVVRFMNENGSPHYNIDGIADVLLALDRIEQDEELSYEQLLALETNLFLGGLNLYDQHRDMRLDIDNMSYEELLVLEEKMGTVSTALSEEELSKCIKTSVFISVQLEKERTGCNSGVDDSKCSICQEEFVRGDKIGSLKCGHGYHTPCINQWLQLKNWCPICKASPKPSSASSPA